jgi:hypothetical protein
MTTSSQTKEKESQSSIGSKTEQKAEVIEVEQEPDEIDLYRSVYTYEKKSYTLSVYLYKKKYIHTEYSNNKRNHSHKLTR